MYSFEERISSGPRVRSVGIWEYIKGIFIILGIPIISFLMAPWDPLVSWSDVEGPPLGAWFVAIPYWVVLFYAHKYKWQYGRRARQLGILIDEHFTKEEKEEIRGELQSGTSEKRHFLEEYPELAKEIELREDRKRDRHKIAHDIATALLACYQVVKEARPKLIGQELYRNVLETLNLNFLSVNRIKVEDTIKEAEKLAWGDGVNLRKITWALAMKEYIQYSDKEETLDGEEEKYNIPSLKEKWPLILVKIRLKNYFSLETILKSAIVTKCTKTDIILEVPYAFHQRIIETPKNKRILESIISSILGKNFKVSVILASDDAEAAASIAKSEREFKKDYFFIEKMRDEIAKIIPEEI